MATNDKIWAEADRRANVFFQTAASATNHLHPARIVDQLLGRLDPHSVILHRFTSKIKDNPFALLVAVVGVWIFTQQLTSNELVSKTTTRQGRRPHRLPRAIPKGE